MPQDDAFAVAEYRHRLGDGARAMADSFLALAKSSVIFITSDFKRQSQVFSSVSSVPLN